MKISNIILLIIVVIIIVAIGGFLGARYYFSAQGPQYLFMHPTMAKIFQVTPVCPTVCVSGGVCGKDGKNYCNQCVAFKNKAGYAHDGACIPASWQTYTDSTNGLELRYPKVFSGAVWQAQTWPPSVTVVANNIDPVASCGTDISSSSPNVSKGSLILNGMDFTTYIGADAGAGQLYTNYCYILDTNNQHYVIDFVIHSTNGCGNGNCGPWCGTPNEQACKTFDMQKEVVQPIEKIISTFKFIK